MPLPLCRHIKTNGTRCKAPSLTEGHWCYFHHRLHQRHRAFRPTEATRGYLIPGQHIELTALEDRESVQVALSVVINALATGQLDIKRATAPALRPPACRQQRPRPLHRALRQQRRPLRRTLPGRPRPGRSITRPSSTRPSGSPS